MKRHEQTTGVRKWSGDDLVELQSEALTVLDDFFAQYGDVVVNGCTVSDGQVASGLVSIGGKVMPFAGMTGITTYPVYLVSSVSYEQREYVDGGVKNIAEIYTATATQTKPTSDYIEIPSNGSFTKFFDNVDSTWLTDLKTRLLDVEAYDITVATALAEFSEFHEDHEERISNLEPSATIEVINVTLNSNQGTYDESLLGITVSVSYSNTILAKDWAGAPLSFLVPDNETYTISAAELSSYSSPFLQSYTAIGGDSRDVFMNYSCERVVVTLTSDGDASLTAQTVTIKNSSTGVVIGSGTGEQVVVKVPTGTSYTISVSDFDGYVTPDAYINTATLIERYIEFQYSPIPIGYIYFDKSISDSENILGDINSGTVATILSKFRRCLCKKTDEGSVAIAYLNNANSNYYEDGTAAVLTGAEGDVMVDFPEFYYKYESVDDNIFRYAVSELNAGDSYIHVSRSLVGAYKGHISDTKLYSVSGVASTGSVSQANFLAYAEARGTGYQIIDFQQHCVIAFMLYAKYGNRNLQAILGVGGADYSSNNISGTTNSIGNTDTENESGTGNYVNGLGVEGVFGGIREWVKGVSITSGVWTITDPDGTIRARTAGSSDGWITNIAAEDGAPFDVVPTAVGGSESTHYTDYYYCSSPGPFVLARSNLFSLTIGGVAYTYAASSSSTTSSFSGSRLAFRGVIEEATSVTAFKALSVL